jgi:hypothetical protein
VPYRHTPEDINRVYSDSMKLSTRMPDALGGTMGNQVLIATFHTLDGVNQFVQYSFE